MARIIVLDTSFLIELFGVPVDSNLALAERASELMAEAIDAGYDVYVPLPVVYELANHIVDVKNSRSRLELSRRFTETVNQAWETQVPFTIVPCENDQAIIGEIANLPKVCERYEVHIDAGLSLADCTTVDLAESLKASYRARRRQWRAHIWTTHVALKAMEPDNHPASLI